MKLIPQKLESRGYHKRWKFHDPHFPYNFTTVFAWFTSVSDGRTDGR